MAIVNWLNENSVLVSKNLADLFAAFEFNNGVDINDESVFSFIQEVVNLTQQVLHDSTDLKRTTAANAVAIIHAIICQLDGLSPLSLAIYQMSFRITGQVKDFQLGDDTDKLIKELIRCTYLGISC
jgi:hypothetical protein